MTDDEERKESGTVESSAQDHYLPEADRKAILKSHKIKITDLRSPLKDAASTNTVDEEAAGKKDKKKKKTKGNMGELAPAILTRKQQKALRQIYPHPLTQFAQLRTRYNISRRLAENILNQGYTVPTEVQLGSLPLQLGDCPDSPARGGSNEDAAQPLRPDQQPDLLVVAPTGSGKTLAFMIPIINNVIKRHHEQPGSKEICSIIVAPTKELVAQIVNEGRKLVVGTGVRITAMRKGMRVVESREVDEEMGSEHGEEESSEDDETTTNTTKKKTGEVPVTKSDILVSTPLLLVNALSNNRTMDIAPLPSVRSLVLDEADVLLDPLFREQTLSLWNACTNPQLRVGLWSATMGSNIEELANSTIRERQASLSLKEESSLVRLVVGLKDSAIPNISHRLIYAATEQGKLLGLRQLLHPTAASSAQTAGLRPPFLVFTQTIARAVALHSELMYDIPPEAGGSSRIAVLHAELSDSRRSDIMAGFRKGEIWILITTDLLARGVDFRGVNGVVNYDIPNSSAAYVHRVGRTGRAGREGGVAVTYYTKEDIPYVKAIANVIAASEKLRGADVGERSVQKWLLDSLPDLSKKDRKELKQHGVQMRRPAARAEGEGKAWRATRITTKSGYERRMENNRRGAVMGSKRRKEVEKSEGNDDDWSGIED
jgi:ATP-dependent RNA helicase DDX52/ROK1